MSEVHVPQEIKDLAAYPGTLSAQLIDELQEYVIVQPHPFVVDLSSCEGTWLGTVDGQRIFDWAGYYASRLIGHNHPAMNEPDYVRRLVTAANNKTANPDFLTRECLDYYRLVHSLAPVSMRNPAMEVYVVNSGAEAVENMMKYFINLHLQKRPDTRWKEAPRRFIYFDQAFHGRTVFALNVTRLEHDPVITRGFHGIGGGNYRAPFPAVDTSRPGSENVERMERSLDYLREVLQDDAENIVGIIVEPLQGAGGHRIALPEFYRRLSELAHRFGVALGFDEVQTAGGQTGTVFAIDQFDLPHPPQAIAAAKKFGCGVVYMLHPMEDHGVLDSTWGGSLADMVRFCQEWKVVNDERLIEQVAPKTKQLLQVLRSLEERFPDVVSNIRGMGLYQGLSLRTPEMKSALVKNALEQEDLLLLGAGTDSVRLRPNLSVTLSDIDFLGEKLHRLLSGMRDEG